MEINQKHYRFLCKDWGIRILTILPFLFINASYLRLYVVNRKLVSMYGSSYSLIAGSSLDEALKIIYPVFAFIIALSFIAFHRFRADGIRDLINLYSPRHIYLKTFLFLELLHLLIFINILVLFFIFYLPFCQPRADYFLQIVKNIVCWYGLLPLLAIVIGIFLSYMKSYQGAIVAYIAILLAASPLPDTIHRTLAFDTLIDTSAILKYFKLMPLPAYDIQAEIDYLGHPVTSDTVWLLLFWIFLFGLGIILVSGHRSWYLLAFNGGICVLSILFLIDVPHDSRIEFGDVHERYFHPDYYYSFLDKSDYANSLLTAKDYGIRKYAIELSVNDGMQAQVTINIDDSTESEYLFTLYHTYRVNDITNQDGKPLAYTQTDDYIRIQSDSPVTQLVFHYAGSAPGCYSLSDGIHLNSYFPFYPIQGIQAVYDTTHSHYVDHQMNEPISFYVSVDSNKQVYSNLKETSYNTFEGEETGFFLLSGFVETYQYKDVTVLYPYTGKGRNDYTIWNDAIDDLLSLEQEYSPDGSNHLQYIMLDTSYRGFREYTYGSNYAQMAVLTTDHMIKLDGYNPPDESAGYALYKHYLETGHNEPNAYFYN